MNIKLKLSLQFTLIVLGILVFFAVLVHYFFYTSQLNKYRESLYEEAKNTAILLIDVKEVDSTLLKKIQQSTISLVNEEIVLTDSSFKLVYDNHLHYLTDEVIRQYATNSERSFFSIGEKDGVFYIHKFKNKIYYVYVMAYDKARYENLSQLRNVLVWSILISILLSIYLSYLFSRHAIQPISRIIKSVKAINSQKLNSRLDEGNRRDEIAQLAITFNEMLADLESAFKNQEDFVSNASHELRTPLTIMMIESDYIISHDRTKEEYISYISGLTDDIKKINELLNSLLEIAHLNRDNRIQLSVIRIDEIVYNAIQQVKVKYPRRKIVPKIVYPENQDELLVQGNAGLLTIAFKNLIENACKFSEDDVIIEFVIMDECIKIIVSDKGSGIPSHELKAIFAPFARASNVKFKSGYGIGLSLVAKIMEVHDVDMQVFSEENKGTRFELLFRRLKIEY